MTPARIIEPEAVVPFRDLETLKRWHSRLVEATLDELSPDEAIAFVEWLKDDATARVIEMDSAAGWPP